MSTIESVHHRHHEREVAGPSRSEDTDVGAARAASMHATHIGDTTGFAALPGRGVTAAVDDQQVIVGNRTLMDELEIPWRDTEAQIADLEQQGSTVMLVAVDGRLAGLVAVADTLKDHAAAAIADLRRQHIDVVMLTGDNERTAHAIARQLGIERVVAGVLPDGKADEIRRLRAHGDVVAMVGDGVNDAPALATADIGIALGSGSDVAKETGGIVLVRDDVRDVATAIRLSRATMRKIHQNLFWAFAYNSAAVPIAALGLLNPMIAAAAMALSSLSVIGNSATLKRLRLEIR
jgi:P-type Cu+ transporter